MKQDKNEIKEFIVNINEIVTDYIKRYLDSNPEVEINDIKPLKNYNKLPTCWEINNCTKKDCPAYNTTDYRCWLKVGTLCGGNVQGVFARKYKTCFNCKVFQQFNDSTINSLYENIAILIRYLGDKTAILRNMAIKDKLTDCYNRHYLDQVIIREQERAKRHNEFISVILFDLNKFKEINDTYGHLSGDITLKIFAEFLNKYTRKSDMTFRIGGDEFLILLPNCNEKQRYLAEKRFKGKLLSIPVLNGSKSVHFTFSMGGASGQKDVDIDRLINKADEAMYKNK